jgi:hypothetical protein
VAELPPEFSVSKTEEHWVVVGPTGIFVVSRAADDPVAAAEHTAAFAHQLRDQLGELTPWVPFVDALVVGDAESPGLACPVIEVDVLAKVLTLGATTMDDAAITQIRGNLPFALAALERLRTRPLDPA